MGEVCTDRAESGGVPVNTGTETKGQLGLCRVQAGAAPALGWELGGQDVAAGVGVPETPRLLTTYFCKCPPSFTYHYNFEFFHVVAYIRNFFLF